jgi:N-acetylmuramoyl-L-alanine amidase
MMAEFLWEIWTGKRNMHHRIQMSLNESPEAVFRRIIQELKNSDKEIAEREIDPNTGKEVDVQWRYAWRNKGEESPLAAKQAMSQQGVADGALFVARPVERRAMTLYIDGVEGLGQEEIAAASNTKRNLFIGAGAFLFFAIAASYLFLFGGTKKELLTYTIHIKTLPKGAQFEMELDVRGLPGFDNKDFIKLGGQTPRRFALRQMAKVIYVKISKEGYKTWEKGTPTREEWLKLPQDKRTLATIDPKMMTADWYFPKALEVMPKESSKANAVAASKPEAITVNYPSARWQPKDRAFRLALDPDHGGSQTGALGATTQQPASRLNLAITNAIREHLMRTRAFKKKIGVTRSKDAPITLPNRLASLKRAKLLLQIDLASALQEDPKNNAKRKDGDKEITYNDAHAGFTLLTSPNHPQATRSKAFATCLANSLKRAGFLPKSDAKAALNASALGIKEAPHPLLDQTKIPAVRLVLGYLSHQKEEKVLTNPDTYPILAQVVEDALLCFLK